MSVSPSGTAGSSAKLQQFCGIDIPVSKISKLDTKHAESENELDRRQKIEARQVFEGDNDLRAERQVEVAHYAEQELDERAKKGAVQVLSTSTGGNIMGNAYSTVCTRPEMSRFTMAFTLMRARTRT